MTIQRAPRAATCPSARAPIVAQGTNGPWTGAVFHDGAWRTERERRDEPRLHTQVGAMPSFSESELPNRELDALIAYLSALSAHGS